MDNIKVAQHETLQVHELLTLKNLTLTKTVTMLPLVTDPELKEIMQNEVQTVQKHIEDLRNIIQNNFQNK